MSAFVLADEIELNPDHPERYTVVRGDTLWDIAGRFLNKPWQWPEIWRDNPDIADPHWIYPGDVLVLRMVDGKPRLQVEQRSNYIQRPDEERISPKIRVEPLDRAIPSIPMNVIQPFLTQTKVADADFLNKTPYLVAMAEEHVTAGAGGKVYARGLEGEKDTGYLVFRPGKPYRDAVTGEVLGHEALYVADASLIANGDPATLLLTKTVREVIIGDRVLPIEMEKIQMRYEPHAPATLIQGHIIAVLDGVSQIGQYTIVVIDRGLADGIETGHVMAVHQSNAYQTDLVRRDYYSDTLGERVALPMEKEGLLMIFRPYERVSFGLILRATRFIHLNDVVRTP